MLAAHEAVIAALVDGATIASVVDRVADTLRAQVRGSEMKVVQHVLMHWLIALGCCMTCLLAAADPSMLQGQEHLVERLSRSLGFGMGLEFRESSNILAAKNDGVARAGGCAGAQGRGSSAMQGQQSRAGHGCRAERHGRACRTAHPACFCAGAAAVCSTAISMLGMMPEIEK